MVSWYVKNRTCCSCSLGGPAHGIGTYFLTLAVFDTFNNDIYFNTDISLTNITIIHCFSV